MARESHPKGYFKYLVALDTETSGLNFNAPIGHAADGYQIVSLGMIVVDEETLKPVDKLYVEIMWNGESKWDAGAEKVHGLTKQYLEANALTEEEAAELLINFLMKYFGAPPFPGGIRFLGQNVATFDVVFLEQMLARVGVPITFGTRHIDTFALGLICERKFNSDDLFDHFDLQKRDKHNSLTDAQFALQTSTYIRTNYNSVVDGS